MLLNGVGQGGGWAPSVKLLVNWFPRERLGTALGLYTTCVSVFTILAYLLSGYLGQRFGWRLSFIVPGLVLACFCSVYSMVVRDSPLRESPAGLGEFVSTRTVKGDFAILLRHRQLWITFVSFFCLLYIQFGGMIWYPTYLHGTFGIDVLQAGTLTAVFPLMGLAARPLGGSFRIDCFMDEGNPSSSWGWGP